MIEIKGNLWDQTDDILCITTNGTVKKNGCAVMGAGCAREAKVMFEGIDRKLGRTIERVGLNVSLLQSIDRDDMEGLQSIAAFPVKYNWYEDANLKLIEHSAYQLTSVMDMLPGRSAVVPRPGCGNGNLSWEDEVKPVLKFIWRNYDNIKVITW